MKLSKTQKGNLINFHRMEIMGYIRGQIEYKINGEYTIFFFNKCITISQYCRIEKYNKNIYQEKNISIVLEGIETNL